MLLSRVNTETQHHHHRPFHSSVTAHTCFVSVKLQWLAMSAGLGAARRRRAWHRHVKMMVGMELATALHHSAQPADPVVEEPSEGEVCETHDALRYGDRSHLSRGCGLSSCLKLRGRKGDWSGRLARAPGFLSSLRSSWCRRLHTTPPSPFRAEEAREAKEVVVLDADLASEEQRLLEEIERLRTSRRIAVPAARPLRSLLPGG